MIESSSLCKRTVWNDPRRYSLIGITHTLSTPGPLQILTNLPQTPLHSWDSLICTSQAAKSAVEMLWDHSEALTRLRGGQPAERPQLPVIPLGIDADGFKPVCSRREARKRLCISSDAAVVLGLVVLSCIAKRITAAASEPWHTLRLPARNARGSC